MSENYLGIIFWELLLGIMSGNYDLLRFIGILAYPKSDCNAIAWWGIIYLDYRFDQRKAPLPLVPLGYSWSSPGYTWLPCDYIKWPRLQKISANDGKNNYKCANEITYIRIKIWHYPMDIIVRVPSIKIPVFFAQLKPKR